MITVYSKTNCPHCVNAKRYLENLNINYREVNIEQDSQAREFILNQGHRSVPQIYIDQQLLVEGGWSALSQISSEEIIDRINRNTPMNPPH